MPTVLWGRCPNCKELLQPVGDADEVWVSGGKVKCPKCGYSRFY